MNNDEQPERLRKVTSEKLLGLVIDDRDKTSITEAFGWDEEKFQSFTKQFNKYRHFVHAAEELNSDMPESTKLSLLVEFLKSNFFRELNIKLDTPNDYFILGFAYCSVFATESSLSALPIELKGLLESLGHRH